MGARPLLAALLGSSVIFSGCGIVDGATARFQDAQQESPSVVTIGVLSAQTGPARVAGTGVVESVRAAVADSPVPAGWMVEVSAVDSFHGDLTGATLTEALIDDAEQLLDDDSVAAVVGGLSESEVLVTAPLLSDFAVPLLSPADEDPTHWRGADAAAPSRPWRAYGVTTVLAAPQETALAEHLVVAKNARKISVVHDGSPGASDRLDDLQRAVEMRGGTVVETSAAASTREVKRAVAAATSTADAVVVLGAADLVARVRSSAGPDLPVAAVAHLLGAPLAEVASELDGLVVARGGPSPSKGRGQLERAVSAGSASPPGPYGVAAYDAARLIMEGLDRCLPRAADGEVAAPVDFPPRSSCADDIVFAEAAGLTRSVLLNDMGARVGMLGDVGEVQGGRWRAVG